MTDGATGGPFREDVRAHDAALSGRGLAVWVGAEPTFTRRDSQEAPWLFDAEGGDKEERARALVRAFAARLGRPTRLVRAKGRLYPGERTPRFSLGARWERGPGLPGGVDGSGLDGEPVDPPAPGPGIAWLTATPDPAVVEVNMAPEPGLEAFLAQAELVYAAAAEAGLSPERYRYDGRVTDSGGGGQVTLGGPTPEESPFFAFPWLLPSLLRFLNHHPSLSYLFAPGCVGSASQGPRPDEGDRERFEELAVALDLLDARGGSVGREELWATLAPLLVDASGNSHRAELNVEKLWNPYLPGRGRLGVVEFRSFGMPRTPQKLAAVAALLRALVARVALDPFTLPLQDWGAALHDRFALPELLGDDLDEVLGDLDAHGLGPGPSLRALLAEPPEPIARLPLDGATLTLSPAREFWPLVGDVASQERSGSRLVDASSERIEALVEAPDGEEPGVLGVLGREVQLVPIGARRGRSRHVAGLRTRAFVPSPGFHPGLPALDPLPLVWERRGRAVAVDLHSWIPGGGVYPGLPSDAAEAARRRAARVVVRELAAPPRTSPLPRRGEAFTVDLRPLAARVVP